VITTPDLQGAITDQEGIFTTRNRYVQIKSLSVDALVFYQDQKKYVFDWDQIVKNLHSIELLSPDLDVYHHGAMMITSKKGEKIKTADATLLQYIGHDQPTSQLTILEYDSYNKWWREAFLDIQKVKKIVFGSDELLKPDPPPMPQMEKKSSKDGFETTADGISKSLHPAGSGQGVNLNIEFDVNSAKIRNHSIPLVQELGKALVSLKPNGKTLLINGHTDSDGSKKYNLKLSKKRAESVKAYLVKHYNLKGLTIRTTGYGESTPIAPNKGKENKQKNRRVEVKLKPSE
jgi:outer membrane protein OmpA-like peptidoglycan-associated protein